MGKETVGWVYTLQGPSLDITENAIALKTISSRKKEQRFYFKVAGQGNFELSNPAGLRGFGVASTPSSLSLSRGGYKPTIEPILREIERAPLTG